jgi:hypothetical protein
MKAVANLAERAHARNCSESNKIEYLLAELRCASLRARLWQSDIDTIGLAPPHASMVNCSSSGSNSPRRRPNT